MNNKAFLASSAYDTITKMIHSGEMKPDTLYSETRLASALGISRTPLRDALHALAQDGYIQIIPSKGFMIRQLSEEDMIETIQIRCAVEGFCVQMIVAETSSRRFHSLIKKMNDCISKMQASIENRDFPKSFIKYDHQFHQLIIDYVGNKEMTNLYQRSMYLIRLTSNATLVVPGRAQSTIDEHKEILNYLEKGDGDSAYRYLIAHLMLPINMKMFVEPTS